MLLKSGEGKHSPSRDTSNEFIWKGEERCLQKEKLAHQYDVYHTHYFALSQRVKDCGKFESRTKIISYGAIMMYCKYSNNKDFKGYEIWLRNALKNRKLLHIPTRCISFFGGSIIRPLS